MKSRELEELPHFWVMSWQPSYCRGLHRFACLGNSYFANVVKITGQNEYEAIFFPIINSLANIFYSSESNRMKLR